MTSKTENKILFLHGLFGQNSSKPAFLQSLGHKVLSPNLNDWSFSQSLEIAQNYFDEFRPDIVVGSSRGGALAMNINSHDVPLILLAPAWPYFGNADKTKNNSIIIHSEFDLMVPISFSEQLANKSDCELIVTGQSHRLNCLDAMKAIKSSINKVVIKN